MFRGLSGQEETCLGLKGFQRAQHSRFVSVSIFERWKKEGREGIKARIVKVWIANQMDF